MVLNCLTKGESNMSSFVLICALQFIGPGEVGITTVYEFNSSYVLKSQEKRFIFLAKNQQYTLTVPQSQCTITILPFKKGR
jgi:hypothetical protein